MLSVLIPAYNESGRIAATLNSLHSAGLADEILVVDDGSSDGTAAIARANGAEVLILPANQGKGGAINAGAVCLKGDFVLLLDADLQDSAASAFCLTKPVFEGTVDMTIARFRREKSGHGFGIARKTASWGIKYLTGQSITAPLSGQRCMKRSLLLDLLPLPPRFGLEVGMTLDALSRGLRVLEMETELTHCPPRRDLHGFFHRGRQFFDVCLVLGSRAGRVGR